EIVKGGLSGLASTVLLQPFDLLKTRLQQRDGKVDIRYVIQRHHYDRTSVLHVTRSVLASDGILGLWRGTVPSLFRNVPGVALYMTSLTQIRTAMARSAYFVRAPLIFNGSATGGNTSKSGSVLPKLSSQGNLLAGAFTRVAVGFLLNPFSVIKARFESNIYQSQYNSFPQAVALIARSGPKELFKGFVPSAMRDAPYAGLFVATYESIKRHTSHLSGSSSVLSSTMVHTVSAGTAGAIATLATHPFDVIKTKVQVRQEDRYHGLRRTVHTIWQQRGISGFFDGASLRVSRKVFSSAIGWAVYEGLLMVFHNNSNNNDQRL
ncbi:mitochondrial carrier, partial [Fomitiporia mediterranea MF3/22]|uniref:mitochondrial carrier n=1 Tax=Fomitiporia mediterranea (strain MF3/22) TaxID=694068 RepID=UPI00044080E0